MGLLDGLEKLINEHGSAVILKERIALAEDKYAALEQKLSASELHNTELESKNKILISNLAKAEIEIQSLKKLTEKPHGNRLDEVKEKILIKLSVEDNYESNLAQNLGISAQVATFHLEELDGMKFIYRSLSMTGQVFPWRLIQEGRRYLITHGLIA